jgi:hypothetical protein
VVLYALNLPNEGYSDERVGANTNSKQLKDMRSGLAQFVGASALLVHKNSGDFEKSFGELADGAKRAELRNSWEGKTIVLRGQYRAITDRDFTLYRMKISCCVTDAVWVNARIIAPEPIQTYSSGNWVEIRGELEFMRTEGTADWVPVVRLKSLKDIKRIEPIYDQSDL